MSTDVPSTASGYFGSMVESYDSLIRRCVPRYEEMTAALLDYLPASPHAVLELGCGTGNLSLELAARFPASRLTLVDAAPEMVALTMSRLQERLPQAAARARPLVARFEELPPEPHAYDLVVSCISLHHVEDKLALYRSVLTLLRPGGTFRFADQMAGGSEYNHAINWSRWLAYCRKRGGCTEDEVESLLAHAAQHDHYSPVTEHLALLGRAGFANVDCVWRSGMWGIVTADVR